MWNPYWAISQLIEHFEKEKQSAPVVLIIYHLKEALKAYREVDV